MQAVRGRRRVAVVAGCRSPFCKAGTTLRTVSAVELARLTVVELIHRAGLFGRDVDEVYFGQVVPSPLVPNLAREIALLPQFPGSIPAATVNRACASANSAITLAHDQIALGHADVVIAGGVESLSEIPILHSRRFADLLQELNRARSTGVKLRRLAAFRPRDLMPVVPAIAEPSTGETMGQAAERMAKVNGVGRRAQDEFALRSHRLAHLAHEDGRLAAEIAPVYLDAADDPVMRDNGVRADASLDEMSQLRPVFDRRHGSVTAGNASPLTDGAAAVVLMAEEVASALGHEPLAYVRSYAVAALDPADQLLLGPMFAIPQALSRAGLEWKHLGLVEMHEAFAAQVLSTIQAIESRAWVARHLGRSEPLGEVDRNTLNVMGGSIALGHPFGATGARLTLTLANEMQRRSTEFGLVSVCAQGGMGFAMILEAA
jgi:acetyl-CoA acyltransferase